MNTSDYLPVRSDCVHYRGAKPCRYRRPCEACPHFEAKDPDPPKTEDLGWKDLPPADSQGGILLIHFEALGAVLQSTAVIPALKRAWPGEPLSFLSAPPARPLLEHGPDIDQVLGWGGAESSDLARRQWKVLVNLDKGKIPCVLASLLRAEEKRGFGWSKYGNLEVLSPHGNYALALGLDDSLKFKKNQMTGQEIFCGLAGLDFKRDPYAIGLSQEEQKEAYDFRKKHSPGGGPVVGINTGCAPAFPYKKLSTASHVRLIQAILKSQPKAWVYLLGGKDEGPRNQEIWRGLPPKAAKRVLATPTDRGLAKGLVWTSCCDVVVSGDTLGMHMAIGLKIPVVAWFSLTCSQEIDLYGRGEKILADVSCGPCWLPSCSQEEKCYDRVPLDQIVAGVGRWLPKA